MAKKATKAADNAFYKARIAAATCNDALNSREGAAEQLGIDRTRLARIELGSLSPYPEEVLLMSDAYNAPELNNYFCSKMCPLGCQTVPTAELLQLDRLTIKILSALGNAEFIQKTIIEVVKDGTVTEDEQPQIDRILNALENISKAAIEMKLWVEKNIR
ncbi:MAG: helix-turn-helix domain-containing protein [Clostridiaceae bacterium]|nr:helix-turn-helix domain-containing protein [Clostridiaceae bacterium]